MKILLITAYYKEEARSIPTSYKLSQMFAEAGHEVIVFTSRAISKKTHESHGKIKIYETKDFFIKDPLNINVMPLMFNDLSKVLSIEKPDVTIISKYIFFPIVAVPYLKMKGQKVVVLTDTYPGVVWFTRSRLVNFIAKMHYHIVGRLFLRNSDYLVLTHEGLVDATKRLGIKNYAVIHTGIDLKKVDSTPPAKLAKKKGELFVTFVGRLASIKGLDTLLESTKYILKKHNNVTFLIVGDGDSSRLYHHPKIKYFGYRKDILGVLKKSDIFVMPSISEGLPSAVVEAMSCSLPVVGSDIPGGMSVLISHNKTGLKFNVGNPEDLTMQLERLITNSRLRANLGKNARAHIASEFDNDSCNKKWIELFNRLNIGKNNRKNKTVKSSKKDKKK